VIVGGNNAAEREQGQRRPTIHIYEVGFASKLYLPQTCILARKMLPI
jgi:hypothetical protein